jgi:dTDP-4-dehydrorhamnose 3,5-epimerase
MKIIATELKDCYIIEPVKFGDNRGWFKETYSEKSFKEAGLEYNFVQDNMSFSKEKGVLRGLHFQKDPFCQAKLVSCIQGSVFDVAVDIRKNSPTYGKWIGVELNPENGRQLLIPRGFLHGFQTLTDDVIFAYKCDNLYSKEHDGGVIYNDPTINVEWPIDNPILSEKDKNQPTFKELIKKEGDLF